MLTQATAQKIIFCCRTTHTVCLFAPLCPGGGRTKLIEFIPTSSVHLENYNKQKSCVQLVARLQLFIVLVASIMALCPTKYTVESSPDIPLLVSDVVGRSLQGVP